MTASVVEALEVIEVCERYRVRHPVGRKSVDSFLERAAVAKPRQGVG